MAKFMDVNKSQFINDFVQIFSDNKVGQYSKFLDRNPTFVTYLHINEVETRADVGIGGIDRDLGPTSPIRFNEILEFPVYGLSDLKPDIEFDESGYDINIDLSDIIILPGTIKPSYGDYMLVVFPNIKEFLFRINQIDYNTIQSNDFYKVSLELKAVGTDLSRKYEGQIISSYRTLFDNIGTEDRCFIKTTDVEKIAEYHRAIDILKTYYRDNFYLKECNTIVCFNNPCIEYVDMMFEDVRWLYDPYLEKFIADSDMFYENNPLVGFALSPSDIIPRQFNDQYESSFLKAVLTRDLFRLKPYIYFFQSYITKRYSPFVVYNYPTNGIILYVSDHKLPVDQPGKDTNICLSEKTNSPLFEYYSVELMEDLKSKYLRSTDEIDILYYKYFTNTFDKIDIDKILNRLLSPEYYSFIHIPLITHILKTVVKDFMKSDKDII